MKHSEVSAENLKSCLFRICFVWNHPVGSWNALSVGVTQYRTSLSCIAMYWGGGVAVNSMRGVGVCSSLPISFVCPSVCMCVYVLQAVLLITSGACSVRVISPPPPYTPFSPHFWNGCIKLSWGREREREEWNIVAFFSSNSAATGALFIVFLFGCVCSHLLTEAWWGGVHCKSASALFARALGCFHCNGFCLLWGRMLVA